MGSGSQSLSPESVRHSPGTPSQQGRLSACASCYRLKLKCNTPRPCRACQRRGIACVVNTHKAHACTQCKDRKTRCNRQRPCQNCLKYGRNCDTSTYPFRHSGLESLQSPITVTSISEPEQGDSVSLSLTTMNTGSLQETFDLASFDFDLFSVLNFPDPAFFFNESPTFLLPENHALVFDDIDRSRLIYSLNDVPDDSKGELPSPNRLTEILRQYFENISPLAPIPHVPSFSVRLCPSTFLMFILGIGDTYSSEKTVERWARKAAKHMVRLEVHKYETLDQPLSIPIIQAISIAVLEHAYSGDAKQILQATHYRVTLASACRTLQEEEEEDDEPESEDEVGWILWVKRETRRRTLMQVYLTDTSISMHQLWFADSYLKWQQIRHSENQLRRGESTLHFSEILSDILHNDGKLLSQCNEIIDLTAVSIGLQEIISMTRRLMEVDGRDDIWFESLMKKSRAAPKFILEMVYKVSTAKDISRLVASFVEASDNAISRMDLKTFNNLVTAASAALLQVETISEFISLDDCISTIRAAVYPNVVSSLFFGGLCLWFSVRVLRRGGRENENIEVGIISRLKTAVASIQWENRTSGDPSITVILGDLLMHIKIWGMLSIVRADN